jgi:hypothetical protein
MLSMPRFPLALDIHPLNSLLSNVQGRYLTFDMYVTLVIIGGKRKE